jgi:penicillin-binding protein 1A
VAPFRIVSKDGERKEAKVQLEQEPKVEGALLALDVRSGGVRAMVGGYDFEQSKFNRATQAMRQVGSAFKPIVYRSGGKAGYTPATIIVDAPSPSRQQQRLGPQLRLRFPGPIPVRKAIEQSRNIRPSRRCRR